MIKNFFHYFHSRPRLLIGIAVGILVYLGLDPLADSLEFLPFAKAYGEMKSVTHLLVAWNIGVWTFLGLVFYMMYHADSKGILQRAHAEDEGTGLMILLVFVTAVVSVVAIVQELGVSKDAKGLIMAFHLGLTFLTILTAWLFIHILFALHYTHTYFLVKEKKDIETLDFPNDKNDQEAPNYWDFLYFSLIIGTSGQTADVAFNSTKSRQLGSLHCVLAFFFNASVLALLINMASGLMGDG